MHSSIRYTPVWAVIATFAAWCLATSSTFSQSPPNQKRPAGDGCANNDSGLKLPAGFCATVFADGIGHARHLVVAPDGVVYVNTWSGRYYGNDTPHAGEFIVALQDTSGGGKADVSQRFGETVKSGGAGGTGIGLYNGASHSRCKASIGFLSWDFCC